jgi:hypothetical protein
VSLQSKRRRVCDWHAFAKRPCAPDPVFGLCLILQMGLNLIPGECASSKTT